MAWETGTASNHVDLFNKIRDFLTTNADLVAAGQNWTQELGPTGVLVHGDQITLRGPGLAGNDNIYFGMETFEDTDSDIHNLNFWGHSGFNSGQASDNQPLMSQRQYVLLWNQPIEYWLMANGRRWVLVAKVSTVYFSAYCGFILPYATPSEYPFPMLVAGSAINNDRYSTTDGRSRFMASPGYNTMFLYYPDNIWRRINNYRNDTIGFPTRDGGSGYVYPTRCHGTDNFNSRDDETITSEMDTCFDGSYLLRQLVVIATSPYDAQMGVLEGAFWVPGRGNSPENIITHNSQDYMVVQNLFRTGFRDYMAVRLD